MHDACVACAGVCVFFVCMRARSMVDLRMKFRLVSSIVSIGCPESLLRM